MDEGLKVTALAAVGYPVSVLAAVVLGVPLRYAWRQGVACYLVLWVPVMAAYLWAEVRQDMDFGEQLQKGFEQFMVRGARRPSVITEPRTRGAGCVAMVWENGVLLRVEFGQNAAEAKGRAMAAVASWEREMVER